MTKKQEIMQTNYSDLTDSQWQFIEPFLKNNQPKKLNLRTVLNAILWITRTGVQWRNLESKYPCWESVYYYFRKWQKDETIYHIMSELSKKEREQNKKEPTPSLVAVDSQSVKVAPFVREAKGIDGNKKINGRKRHIVVDSLGLPVAIYVGSAQQHDGEAGLELLPIVEAKNFERLKLIRADKAYNGVFNQAALWYDWTVDGCHTSSSDR